MYELRLDDKQDPLPYIPLYSKFSSAEKLVYEIFS